MKSLDMSSYLHDGTYHFIPFILHFTCTIQNSSTKGNRKWIFTLEESALCCIAKTSALRQSTLWLDYSVARTPLY